MEKINKRNIAILALLIITPLAVVPPSILFNSDYLSHIGLSFIIAFVYYSIMAARGHNRALWLQAFAVCITIGVLKEIISDVRIEWLDIVSDLYGALIGLRFATVKV